MEIDNSLVHPLQSTFPISGTASESYRYWCSLQGRHLHTSSWILIDQGLINRFAELTDDKQWIHIDVERSKSESIFRSTVAHGFLIISLLPKLIKPSYSCDGFCAEPRYIINSEISNVRFIKAVKADTKIRATTKLLLVKPLKRGVELQLEVEIEDQSLSPRVCLAETIIKFHY